jgi:hypothetical protein
MRIRHKRGDIHEDGKIFWGYYKSGTEYWLDAEAYKIRKEKTAKKINILYNQNKEKVAARMKARRKSCGDYISAYMKKYRLINSEKIKAYHATRMRNKLKNEPVFRLEHNLRNRLGQAFKSQAVKKTKSTLKLVGCTRDQLKEHLVSRLREGMTLENYGKIWHIDHIRPCSSFDLSDKAQASACFHYSNLQPLFAEENLAKSDSF